MWPQIGLNTQNNVQTHTCTHHICTQRYTNTKMRTHTWTYTHTYTGTIITLHYIHLIKKWNSTVPNVLFLNKNAYRGLKRSVLRTKSLFCFNHVWVLLFLNTDIHTYQGNEDTKTPRTPTTSGKLLMWPITCVWESVCVYVCGRLCVLVCVNKPISV